MAMTDAITTASIARVRQPLDDHPVYTAVRSLDDLRCFMQHHVYSVWDFMSLIKFLQSTVAATQYPWTPAADGNVVRFINELVLEEESDAAPDGDGYCSHFELYQAAMTEIGADTGPSRAFVARIAGGTPIGDALETADVPAPSRRFTRTTFEFIDPERPHLAAAALALGREHIIPGMFRGILSRIGVDAQQAPIFHGYLQRHIHLDEDFHAPLSLRLLNGLCAGDAGRIDEAIAAAERAVSARVIFWDGVQQAIDARRAA
jgi:hypothetical protein